MNPAAPTKRQTVNPAQALLIAALQGYRLLVSPALGALFGPTGGCRFTPTCSAYAMEAVRVHGAVRGSVLALRRLARCHPWGNCGHDPVPTPARPATVAAPAGVAPGGCSG